MKFGAFWKFCMFFLILYVFWSFPLTIFFTPLPRIHGIHGIKKRDNQRMKMRRIRGSAWPILRCAASRSTSIPILLLPADHPVTIMGISHLTIMGMTSTKMSTKMTTPVLGRIQILRERTISLRYFCSSLHFPILDFPILDLCLKKEACKSQRCACSKLLLTHPGCFRW